MPTPLPTLNPPSRLNASSNEQFSADVEAFFDDLPGWSLAVNECGELIYAAVAISAGHAVSSANDAARAEAASAFRVSIAYATWSALSAVAGTSAGQSAGVFGPDAGTHTDPVVGGSVSNTGIYSWSTSPAGWRRLNSFTGAAVAWADITSKPSTFTPSSHTHAQSEITGLVTALAAKAATGAIASSGLTLPTSRLAGRVTAATGAIEAIELGAGLDFVDGKLAYVGGSSMVYPDSGIAISSGSGWVTSLAIPSGALVGTDAVQTLSNKTLGSGTVISAGTIQNAAMTGGEIRPGVAISDTGTIAAASPGFRGLPVVADGALTLEASHHGKLLALTGNLAIPANATLALPAGFACAYFNNSGSNKSITITTDTLRHAGTATTGTVTVPQYGLVTLVKATSTLWVKS